MYYEKPSGVSVHDGFPNPATDASMQGVDLNKLLIKNGISTYLMRVGGNDWQAVGIFADDVVIIDRALGSRKNDLVVWVKDNEFALSARHAMADGAEVWGVVTAAIHRFGDRS